ncbi:lipid IV(A) 3-deoxy-D-manno-octulosonic acid transferase [Vibrio mangrovi]
MILRWFYTLLLFLVAPVFLVGLYKNRPGKPPVGHRWKEHFGLTPPLTRNTTETGSPIWIHAVSVGETITVASLIKQLRQIYPNKKIVITTTTPTGAEQAQNLIPEVEHRYAPLDFPFAIKKFIKTIHPSHLLIMETELWPNLLHIAQENGVNISVINARLSEKSYQKYRKFKIFIQMCLPKINHISCQYYEDKKRFLLLGANESQLSVTGSMKYDITISQKIEHKAKELRDYLGKSRPVWIAASTHNGEDELILESHKKILKSYPDALLILVPRHPERFNTVYELCIKNDFSVCRRTLEAESHVQTQVYLGDTMGEMLILIGASDVCFMGGSLLGDTGGHNVLEPAALEVPTLIGPNFYNFHDITTELKNAEALQVVNHAQELHGYVIDLFNDDEKRKKMSFQAKKTIRKNTGAIRKTICTIFS